MNQRDATQNDWPFVLSIAGFDPSSGAGISADLKTFESLGVYGVGVCSANTMQTDLTFSACSWTALSVMEEQLDLLLDRFALSVVKIGVVECWSTLTMLIDRLLASDSGIKIVLDPVLRSSTGFDFVEGVSASEVAAVLEKVFLVTPNVQEAQQLFPASSTEASVLGLAKRTNVLLTGGHRSEQRGVDELFLQRNDQQRGGRVAFAPSRDDVSEKHGSGCVLSSAIAAYIAQGLLIEDACLQAKRYTESFLASTSGLLGYHCGIYEV